MPKNGTTPGRQLGKVSLLALLVAGATGILATTTSTGEVTPANFKAAIMSRVTEKTVPLPTFHFDDADPVASNDIQTQPQQTTNPDILLANRPSSQVFAPQTAASLWRMPEILIDHDSSEQNGSVSASTATSGLTQIESIVPDTLPIAAGTEDALPVVKEIISTEQTTVASTLPATTTLANKPATSAPVIEARSLLSPLAQKLHAQALAPTMAAAQATLQNSRNTVVVESGDTFSGLLAETSIKKQQRGAILVNDLVKEHLSNLRIGTELEFEYKPDGELHSIDVKANRDTRIQIKTLSSGDVDIAAVHLPIEYERVVTSGTIEQSLYLAAEKANLKQSTIMALSDIFEWELDFARDIRKGDYFSMVYDRLYRDGKYIGDGEILAAEFTRGDRRHTAVRFTDDDGRTDYFSPDGQSKRRAFMRHPVDVVRITSRFDPNRLHPVLHKIRAHKGVDYGAPYGSPIYATADGKVAYAGSKNAYGNTVILKHGDDRSTLYAHMSKIDKSTKAGKRVKRGEVIGYVGKSGRVTGTHLHYEFRIAGKHVDPLKVELPSAAPLDAKYLGKLKATSRELFAQLRSVLPEKQERLASKD